MTNPLTAIEQITNLLFLKRLAQLDDLMMGLMVSALAPNSDRAGGLVPLLLLPQAFFLARSFL